MTLTDNDARRIALARALMWDSASGDERAEWLRQADDTFAELAKAASRPPVPPSESCYARAQEAS